MKYTGKVKNTMTDRQAANARQMNRPGWAHTDRQTDRPAGREGGRKPDSVIRGYVR